MPAYITIPRNQSAFANQVPAAQGELVAFIAGYRYWISDTFNSGGPAIWLRLTSMCFMKAIADGLFGHPAEIRAHLSYSKFVTGF